MSMPFAPEAAAFLVFGWIVVFGLLIFVAYKWLQVSKRRKQGGG